MNFAGILLYFTCRPAAVAAAAAVVDDDDEGDYLNPYMTMKSTTAKSLLFAAANPS